MHVRFVSNCMSCAHIHYSDEMGQSTAKADKFDEKWTKRNEEKLNRSRTFNAVIISLSSSNGKIKWAINKQTKRANEQKTRTEKWRSKGKKMFLSKKIINAVN